MRQPYELFEHHSLAQDFWQQNGLPNKQEIINNLMFNDIQKIVKNIFSKPFKGDKTIKDNLFSTVLNPNKLGFFDIALNVIITGKQTAYIIDSTDASFKSQYLADKGGLKLRGDHIQFGGFLKSLPQNIKPEDIDPQLILNIDITNNTSYKPLILILEPFYNYYYNILVNLNYSLMVANTPQIKLNKYRELMLQKDGSSASKVLNDSFIQKQIANIKNAFKSGGNGNKAIYLDGGDMISFDLPNMERYTQAIHILQELIANGIDAPVSYLFGRAPQGMNATGDKDAQQWNNLSKFWYEYVLLPLFRLIEDLFDLENSIFDFTDYKAKLDILNAISKNSLFLKNSAGISPQEEDSYNLLDKDNIQQTIQGILGIF